MRRLATIGLILCGALLAVAVAGAAAKPVVPRAVQLRILRAKPALAYVPTRTASGFHYVSWQKSPSNLEITFDNKAGWEIRFVALPTSGSCRTGMEKSFQLDGNKVYWDGSVAWRCVRGPDGKLVKLLASGPNLPDVALGIVVASGRRIGVR